MSNLPWNGGRSYKLTVQRVGDGAVHRVVLTKNGKGNSVGKSGSIFYGANTLTKTCRHQSWVSRQRARPRHYRGVVRRLRYRYSGAVHCEETRVVALSATGVESGPAGTIRAKFMRLDTLCFRA